MRHIIFFVLLILSTVFYNCTEEEDNIIGSKDHDLQFANTNDPELLANGISSMTINALVFDKEGQAANGMKVKFQTTHGKINQYAVTDSYGEATAVLTSVASETDIMATVKATVLDSAFADLAKKTAQSYQVALDVPGHKTVRKNLKKPLQIEENRAEIKIRMAGIALSAAVQDSIMPADGISKTIIKINVKQTTTQKPVGDAEIYLDAKKAGVPGNVKTNSQGIAAAEITSGETAGVDSILISYGDKLATAVVTQFVEPKLTVMAEQSQIVADGNSTTKILASLLTTKNTPIIGAEIRFSTSAGVIEKSAFTNEFGQASVSLKSTTMQMSNIIITAEFLSLRDSTLVSFVGEVTQVVRFLSDEEPILRDGMAIKTVKLQVIDAKGQPKSGASVKLRADIGQVPDSVITDESGMAEFEYIADAGEVDANASITAMHGSFSKIYNVLLKGLQLQIRVNPDSLPADGVALSEIRVELKQTTDKIPVINYPLRFGALMGSIQQSAETNEQGIAAISYTAGREAGTDEIGVFCGKLQKSARIQLYSDFPASIVLSTNNNFIWVKETGQLEQTDLTATVLGVTGNPVTKKYNIRFTITQGPDGGEEFMSLSGGTQNVSIPTINGKATATFRAGIRSGQVQVLAEVENDPDVAAQSTKIVIRSGPPYMWVDPADPNHIVQRGTILIQPGKHNVAFANPAQEISVTATFADKYNNPIEEGTAVYFTASGGIISTDAVTDALGRASVVLQNLNPFPVIKSDDGFQLSGCCIPNPNDPGRMLDLVLPDFEGGTILNTAGDYGSNDGLAVIIAKTTGQDQFGNIINVYATGMVVFSTGIHTFTATTDKTELLPGETATFTVRLYDTHGNPVAAGSSLKVGSKSGAISNTDLLPEESRYGYGGTYFVTSLTNDLESEDEETVTNVIFELNSPNGDGKISIPIRLKTAF